MSQDEFQAIVELFKKLKQWRDELGYTPSEDQQSNKTLH
jgi:hypothetical protein